MAFKSRTHANRGMKLEKLIGDTNAYYLKEGIADVQKIPTPFKSLGSMGNGLVKGFNQRGYLVDYIGIFKGCSIIFDAKETSKKSFPLENVHEHQYNLLKSWSEMGARAFLIINFTSESKYYYLPFHELQWAWDRSLHGGRKSISLKEFEERARVLRYDGFGMLNYLEGY